MLDERGKFDHNLSLTFEQGKLDDKLLFIFCRYTITDIEYVKHIIRKFLHY